MRDRSVTTGANDSVLCDQHYTIRSYLRITANSNSYVITVSTQPPERQALIDRSASVRTWRF